MFTYASVSMRSFSCFTMITYDYMSFDSRDLFDEVSYV